MEHEIVKSYKINGAEYDVVGYADDGTPAGKWDYYDVFDEDGACLNEGEPYFTLPSQEDVKKLIKAFGQA